MVMCGMHLMGEWYNMWDTCIMCDQPQVSMGLKAGTHQLQHAITQCRHSRWLLQVLS